MRIIQESFSSETATQKSDIHNDVFFWKAHFLTHELLHPIGRLYRSPDLQFILLVMSHTIQGFHTAVGLIRCLVNNINLLFGLSYNAVRVSLLSERQPFVHFQGFFLLPENFCCT